MTEETTKWAVEEISTPDSLINVIYSDMQRSNVKEGTLVEYTKLDNKVTVDDEPMDTQTPKRKI